MGPLTFVSVLLFIHGVIQILNPEIFVKLKIQGAHTRKGVRTGGFIAIPVSILLFVIDLI